MGLYAFDGTNDDDSKSGTDAAALAKDTNVFRFCKAYYADQGITCDYVPGVGTRLGTLGKVIGGAVGAGWLQRKEETYYNLCKNYVAGDTTIDVIGFSRGAAMAIDFVNKLASDGIAQSGRVVQPAPPVRFLGLFDAVSAYGIANLGGVLSSADPFHKFTLPANVRRCFHAMALDERRPQFVNHRVAGAYEVWFRGVHSDIGGANNNPGLEYIALRWMLHKAIGCTLPVDLSAVPDSVIDPKTRINPNLFSTLSQEWPRTVYGTDLLHYTVAEHVILDGEQCLKCPAESQTETNEYERTRLDAAKPAAT